jgi:uncharacterized membrane protein HdeD (DUF308 family)
MEQKKMDKGKRTNDPATLLAATQIVFGIVIFTSAWWLPEESRQTSLYVFGFLTVLMGILTAVLLSSRR